MAGRRLCLFCEEFKVVKGEWDDICPECKDIHGVRDRPEPADVGDCECWFDGSDCKIHICQQRRELAKKQVAEGKTPMLKQCVLCETAPKYMPKKARVLTLFLTAKCHSCGEIYEYSNSRSKYCRNCKNNRISLSNKKSHLAWKRRRDAK